MGFEFHAVSIPRTLLDKYRGTANLHHLYSLSQLRESRSPRFEEVEPELRAAYGESLTKEKLEEFRALLERGETPVDEVSVGQEWGLLQELFEAGPTVFGKCFEGGERAGDDGLDAIWGDDIELLAEGLRELDVEEEALQAPVAWLRDFYSKAAANDWAVLRCVS